MKFRFRMIVLFLVVLTYCATDIDHVWAEATSEPGPNTANFKLVNNGSGINQYTGSLNWKYNLLTVPGRGGLDFPIDLTYNSGIGCEQAASWVGLGFGLNLGSIERSVIYAPDDMLLYAKRGNFIYQHDGWLFDDNYSPLPTIDGISDSLYTDGPDMWTVSLREFGVNMVVVADSANVFREHNVPFGPAGKSDLATYDGVGAPWKSKYQRSFGLALRVGNNNYAPDSLNSGANNERQRHCYVSPPMGTTVQGRLYNYSGDIQLAFNDTLGGYATNTGQCSVFVYKLPAGQQEWLKSGPFAVSAQSASWLNTGVSLTNNDRFAILCKSRRFMFEKWQPARVEYEVSFTDWDGYYLNPEIYTDPNHVLHQGFTPRLTSFAITSEAGKVYKFETSDYVKATARKWVTGSNGWPTPESVTVAFDNSYKLTAICSSDYIDANANGIPDGPDKGSWIHIVYDTMPIVIDYSNKNLTLFQTPFGRFATDDDSVWQRHYIHYPRYVETPTHRLTFYLSDRRDNLGAFGTSAEPDMRPKRLDSLVLYATSDANHFDRLRSYNFRYADCLARPTSFADWRDNETLAWHSLRNRCGPATCEDSIGKLTLLGIWEGGREDSSLPSLRFRYTSNPRYDEQKSETGQVNENVDYCVNNKGGISSYYGVGGGYQEDWGFYRASLGAKPGLDQQAWSLREILYPTGAKETITWESNRYIWWGNPGGWPGGTDRVNFRSMGTDDTREDGGVERGGIRVRSHGLSGEMGGDILSEHTYGEGIATKSQQASRKAPLCGYIGNSQEVAYRSVLEHLAGDDMSTGSLMLFTNGTEFPPDAVYNDGRSPSPPINTLESFPDKIEDGKFVLEGVKRGLPYKQFFSRWAGDTARVVDTRYDFVLKAEKSVDLGVLDTCGPSFDGRARSTWVRTRETNTRQFDENGTNPIQYRTTLDYDALNGLVSEVSDSVGNGLARKSITEYLHTQDGSLQALLERKNILDLVCRKEFQQAGGGTQTASKTTFDYKDFGDERVYPWHQYEYRKIDPAEIETTTFAAYDAYGNLRLKIDPAGRKTSYLSGYAGSQQVLEASNADTTEVTYNGFEDGAYFDGWICDLYTGGSSASEGPGPNGNVELSVARKYSGDYSARVWDNTMIHNGADGPLRTFPVGALVPGKYYVFSGWVYRGQYTNPYSTGLRVFTSGGLYFDTIVSTPSPYCWTRVEIVFQALNQDMICCAHVGMGDTAAYFDDLRIQPVDCPLLTFAFDRGTGQLQAAFDANNVAAKRYYFDGFGRLGSVLDPDGNTIARYAYTYSRVDTAAFNPSSPNSVKETLFRSANDSTVTITYFDGLGREVQKQVSVSATSKIVSGTVYNNAGQVAAVTKPIEKSGALGSMAYETGFLPAGWAVGTAMTSGDLNSYYDADGPGPNCSGLPFTRYLYTKDPLRRARETGYPGVTWITGSGRSTRIKYLSNAASDVAGWDGLTLVKTKLTDEGGRVSYAYADRLGRIIQTQADSINADGSRFKTLFAYDILGNRTSSIRQHSETVTDTSTWVYNALGQAVQETTPDGGTIRTIYDLDGNTRFVMDAVREAANQFVYYRYDALGRKVEEGTASDVARFTQDNANTASFPSSSYSPKFFFRYDSTRVAYGRGRLSSWADSAGSFKRCYKYDQLGRVIEEYVKLEGVSNTLVYTYDWQGNLATQAITVGAVLPPIYYTYDMANRLAGVGVSGAPYRYDEITYWPTGGVRSHAYKTTAAAVCQTVDYKYNPRDWLIAINDTSAVSAVASGTGDHFAEALGYRVSFTGDPDTVGSKLSTYAGSTELVSYDSLGRLARWHRREAGTDTTGDEIYSYDRAGNVLYWKLGSTTAGFYHTYHPGTNRLKRITTSPQDTVTSYQWYPNGHLQFEPSRFFQTDYRNLNTFINMNQSYPFQWDNSLTFAYDADRQRVKKVYNRGRYCACDPNPAGIEVGGDSVITNRLHPKSSPPSEQAAIEAALEPGGVTPPAQEGKSASRRPNGVTPAGLGGDCVCRDLTTTLYLYTYDGRLVREYVNNATQRDFLYAGSQRIGVSEKIGTAFRLHYFITDHLGSTRSFIDSTGLVKATYNYYPFGGTRTSTVTTDTKHRYTGKELDDEDIQQYYYGVRYLNGATQCFNSVDPLAAKYPAWSPYCYALANPVRNLDREGKAFSDYLYGMFAAIANNVSVGIVKRPDYGTYRQSGRSDYLSGQIAGDAISIVAGGGISGVGKGGLGVSLAASGGPQAVASLPAAAAFAGVGAWGVGITASATINLGKNTALQKSGEGSSENEQKVSGADLQSARKDFNAIRSDFWKNEANANRANYSPENLARMEKGKPPIGPDGAPVELHHRIPLSKGGTNTIDNLEVLTRQDHRIGENLRLNHPKE